MMRNVRFKKRQNLLLSLLIVVGQFLAMPLSQADRIKDIATLQGVQANQLVGVGLVTGLDGTGDQTTQAPFTCLLYTSDAADE